jgi:hypothetical protein
MIMSVSTLIIGSGAATLVSEVNFSIGFPFFPSFSGSCECRKDQAARAAVSPAQTGGQRFS